VIDGTSLRKERNHLILKDLQLNPFELERRTGWSLKPEGACKGERCIPLPHGDPEQIDVRVFAKWLQMPLIHDMANELWCLGPEAGGRALASAVAPELILPDVDGHEWRLSSLQGSKVLLIAWASW
jgi:hypothetical protein